MTPKRAAIVRTLERNGANSAMTVSTHAASNAATAIKAKNMSSEDGGKSSRVSKDHESVVDYIKSMRSRRQTNPLEYSAEGLHAKQAKKDKTLRNG